MGLLYSDLFFSFRTSFVQSSFVQGAFWAGSTSSRFSFVVQGRWYMERVQLAVWSQLYIFSFWSSLSQFIFYIYGNIALNFELLSSELGDSFHPFRRPGTTTGASTMVVTPPIYLLIISFTYYYLQSETATTPASGRKAFSSSTTASFRKASFFHGRYRAGEEEAVGFYRLPTCRAQAGISFYGGVTAEGRGCWATYQVSGYFLQRYRRYPTTTGRKA